MRIRLAGVLWLGLAPCWLGAADRRESTLAAVAARLPPRPSLAADSAAAALEQTLARVLARPDPGTFFNRYVFGLQRHAATLLAPAAACAKAAAEAWREAPTRFVAGAAELIQLLQPSVQR
jgi:hypothetical protein